MESNLEYNINLEFNIEKYFLKFSRKKKKFLYSYSIESDLMRNLVVKKSLQKKILRERKESNALLLNRIRS